MLSFYKKVGETPLEMLDRLRLEKPDLKNETLSYAGRLDPMAQGETLVLVGEVENSDRQKYLGFDKEYIATFMIGMKTDTGDALGLIEENIDLKKINQDTIKEQLSKLTRITKQKYPWFSSKTVDGIKLFDHYKKGNLEIDRPERKIEIKDVELLKIDETSSCEIKKYIFDSISGVKGDFRQEKILELWKYFFDQISTETKIQTFEIKILVSSGTYIRALTEEFDFPTTLLRLNRTKNIV